MLLRRSALALLASLMLGFAVAGDARAQILLPPARDCPDETLEQPFSQWGDRADYVLAPDGGFENGAAGWRLRRAQVIAGGRPLGGRSPEGTHALAVSQGDSAKSPTFCVGLGHPTIRFFARNTGSPLGALAVSVVARTSLGLTVELPVGVAASWSHRWSPSMRMPLVVNLLTLTGGEARVALRFTAVGLFSSWEIDDVYVDPYAK